MKIVTGSRGTPHITSNDDQGRNQGIFGKNSYVLNVGLNMQAELSNANTVSISDGEGIMQGVHFRVAPGTVDTVTIENGTTGFNRIDLICARYTKNAGTGIESVEWAVVKGTPTASTPSAPAYTEGDILAGDLVADFPIYKVTFTGVSPALMMISKPVILEQKTLLWETGDPTTTPDPNTIRISTDISAFTYIEVEFALATFAGTLNAVRRCALNNKATVTDIIPTTDSQSNTVLKVYVGVITTNASSGYIDIERGTVSTVGATSVTVETGNYYSPVKVWGIQ